MFIKYSPFNVEAKKKPRKRTYLILLVMAISGILLFVFLFRPKSFHPSNTLITTTNASTLERLGHLEYDSVYKVAFSPDGKILAVAQSNEIAFFDTNTGKQINTLTPTLSEPKKSGLMDVIIGSLDMPLDELYFLRFDPNGDLLVSGSRNVENSRNGRLVIWDVKSGKAKHIVSTSGGIIDVQFNFDGSILAFQKFDDTNDITLILVDTQSGEQIRAFSYSVSFALSPTSNVLAYYTHGGIALMNMTSGDEQLLPFLTGSRSLAFSPDGTQLLVDNLDITALDINSTHSSILHTLPASRMQYQLSPNNPTLATGYSDWQPEGGYRSIIRVWNYRENSTPYTLEKHDERISTLAFSVNGEILASGDFNGIMKVWDLDRKVTLKTVSVGDYIEEVVFSPIGNLLVVEAIDANGKSIVDIWGISD